MKSKITEIKNSLEGIKINLSRQKKKSANLKIGQWKLSSLKNRKGKKMKKSEQSQRNLWDTVKQMNIFIMRIPVGEENEKRA